MRVLQYAVRPSVALRYFGHLCAVLAVLTLAPLAVSLVFGDYRVALRYAATAGAVFALGAGLMRLRTPGKIQTNEAMVVAAAVFLFSPLVMSWPVMASGLGFADALFETVSAATTTGLSTVPTLEGKPETFLFSRAWMQWVGGLGIVVLSLAAMIQPGLAAKRLDISEDFEGDLAGSTRTNARRVLVVYAILTAASVLLLFSSGIPGFESVLYSFAAVSTGGFSPAGDSIGSLGGWAQAAVVSASLAGGVPLVLYAKCRRKGWRSIALDRQFQTYLAAGFVATALVAFFLWFQDGMVPAEALRHGAVNALSAQSTAGFSSVDVSGIGPGAKLSLIFAMALGGCIGSTAGGVKIFRLLVVLRLIHLVLQRAAAPPDAVLETGLEGRKLDRDEIQNSLCIVAAFVCFLSLSWLAFVAFGHDPLDSLFEVVSALGTAGLSSGVTSAALNPFLKGVLCFDMLLGRLEIVAWLVFFYPATWAGARREE